MCIYIYNDLIIVTGFHGIVVVDDVDYDIIDGILMDY